jgi:BRCT domain type II-containing protein
MRFCITGTFALPRKIIGDILTKHGGIVADSITQQTTWLIVGEDSSSKVEKAREYGIGIIEGIDGLEGKFEFLRNDIGGMKLFGVKKEGKGDGGVKPVQGGLF